jgi:hypothetical protein
MTLGSQSSHAVDFGFVAYPEYQDGYVLTGKITTDGTIGDLTGHITAWEWYTSNGVKTYSLNSSQANTFMNLVGVISTADGQILLPRLEGEVTTNNLLELGGPNPNEGTMSLYWRSGAFNIFTQPILPQPATDTFGIRGSRANPLPAWIDSGFLNLPSTTGPIVIATIIPVPEPSTYVLTLLGIAGLGVAKLARRR